MARTQAADFADKRAGILARAAELFAARGFAATSVADIARACDISKALLYHYCPSKEAMLFEIMRRHVSALTKAAAELALSGSPEERFCQLTTALLAEYAGAAAAQKVLLYELDALGEDQRREIVGEQRKLVDMVQALLGAALPAVAERPSELRARTMLFFGMINWTNVWFKSGGPINRAQLARIACNTMLGRTR